ncbi:MAG: HAMP domain-containing sensor histidine kinase [Solirubrobacteraceae bacterium]
MRSLRGRLSLGIGLVIALVLGAFGVLISNEAERIARDGLDDRLRRTADLSQATAADAFQKSLPRTDDRIDALRSATGSSLRLLIGDTVVLSIGPQPLRVPPGGSGLQTVTQAGERYRVLVRPLPDTQLGDLARLEVTSSLGELERRQAALDQRLLRLGLVALLLAAAGTFLAATALLGPLRRLRSATGQIGTDADLDVRVSETDGPAEVRGLATSFNAMLARLGTVTETRERALAATRRFALDAGHELRTPLTTVQATLSALHRHPDVGAEQRTAMLADALAEQRRLVILLDGLQAYARGDAMSSDHVDVDLADVVADEVAEAGRYQPAARIEVVVPEAAVVVRGSEGGLRMLVANLVANAAHHGAGGVWVRLTDDPRPVLTVEDDGDGVPVAERERVFAPFERLPSSADREGSGLGLALVAQQIREHGADIEVADSPHGGARFVVTFAGTDPER